ARAGMQLVDEPESRIDRVQRGAVARERERPEEILLEVIRALRVRQADRAYALRDEVEHAHRRRRTAPRVEPHEALRVRRREWRRREALLPAIPLRADRGVGKECR